MHLIRSGTCRSYLCAHGGRHHPAPRLGSKADFQRHTAHDNKLPPQQAFGPVKLVDREREVSKIPWDLHHRISESFFTCTLPHEVEPCIREHIQATEISWTQCVLTLEELQHTVQDETEPIGVLQTDWI